MHPSAPRVRQRTCRACVWTRYFLVVAAVLVIGLWSGSAIVLPEGFDYSLLVGDVFLWAFLAVLVVKWIQWRRSPDDSGHHHRLTWLGQSRPPGPRGGRPR
jgi:hypothetical protein